MLKRLVQVFAALVVLAIGAAVLLPLLIPAQTLQPQGSARAAATPDSRFMTIPFPGTGGLEIHYLERPAAAGAEQRAFLLLHGFTFNSFTWGAVLDPLAELGRTVAYDQLPYGLSAKPLAGDWSGADPYAKESAIAQVGAVMQGLGLGHAILVGNSSGGTLALEAALAYPERVTGLILVAPWVHAQRPTIPAAVAQLTQLQRLSLFIARKLGNPTLLEYSYQDPARLTAARRDQAIIHTRVANWDLAWGALLDRSLSSAVDISDRLGQVRVPVLLITSDQDKLVKPEDTRRVAAALPHATLKVLPGCGHVPQEECPRAFMAAVSEWLQSPAGPGAPGAQAPGETAPGGNGGP
ncbi:alpha/beta fold hydrolase [Candidatus Thiodictyon syntrophicum]|jgi:pimeloyl-ACP methyl ester carboxylesterase|uniref:Alpha/beta hydrolase n=1 Tax=Candidatus Thiodictyon syntrophicum TaxID=1166950 RepID=A0A2K8UJ88_9GAMM|nr:alpha/beta hydrolase [Candidatus Thiodictyon syntrophicum]AUB85582.1 alpha/beta hydrolase [Candidatus Thiodictyon syntrophicum]